MICERCDGTGWIITPDGGAGTAARCPCVLDRPIEERLARAGVPREFWDPAHPDFRVFVGPQDPRLAEFPQRYTMLTFTGATGRGKSRQAAEVVKAHLLRGGRARWWEVGELLVAIKERFGLEPGPEAIVNPLLDARILVVLDEAWAEQNTDFNAAEVSRIIRRRKRDAAPTIVTTNLGETELERIEPRLHSRLWGSLVLTPGGEDWRAAGTRP